MDSKAIETLAVTAVKDSIVKSKYLDQFIPDNDKEPSWDGNVYIYNHEDKKKEHLVGRMPVQVKGKEHNDLRKNAIRYKISVTDLRNYLNDGGVIYFVVYLHSATYEKRIYFIELPPIKLRSILTDSGNQKTITLTLKQLPLQSDKLATLFMNCYTNCKQQSSFSSAKLYSLQELKEQGVLESVTTSVSGLGAREDFETAFLTNEVYFYAQIKGSSIQQPLLEIPQELHIQRTVNADICVETRKYYDSFTRTRSIEKTVIKIGDSTFLTLNQDGSCRFNYKSSTNLHSLIIDLSFILDALKSGGFKINELPFALNKENAKYKSFDLDVQEKRLTFYRKVISTLHKLHCQEDIDFDLLDKKGFRNLDYLVRAFTSDSHILSGLAENIPPVINLEIGDLSFILWFEQQSDDPTSYRISDFFETNARFYIAEDENQPISQYALLSKNDLLHANNIQLSKLLPSFKELPPHDYVFDRANYMLLDLLSAYDESNGTRTDLLDTAFAFACWLDTAPPEKLSKSISSVNKLQTIRRMRELKKNEIDHLCAMASDLSSPNDIQVAVHLLLGSQTMAAHYFSKLDSDQQSCMREYPIFHFWNDTKS